MIRNSLLDIHIRVYHADGFDVELNRMPKDRLRHKILAAIPWGRHPIGRPGKNSEKHSEGCVMRGWACIGTIPPNKTWGKR